mmetsp:Transcript_7749/g.20498  ORF Transcript_7749/g.20498 Transcript_7749/m.20498 type:complete len:231 (-) Transcript_7749:458-1150(-)
MASVVCGQKHCLISLPALGCEYKELPEKRKIPENVNLNESQCSTVVLRTSSMSPDKQKNTHDELSRLQKEKILRNEKKRSSASTKPDAPQFDKKQRIYNWKSYIHIRRAVGNMRDRVYRPNPHLVRVVLFLVSVLAQIICPLPATKHEPQCAQHQCQDQTTCDDTDDPFSGRSKQTLASVGEQGGVLRQHKGIIINAASETVFRVPHNQATNVVLGSMVDVSKIQHHDSV